MISTSKYVWHYLGLFEPETMFVHNVSLLDAQNMDGSSHLFMGNCMGWLVPEIAKIGQNSAYLTKFSQYFFNRVFEGKYKKKPILTLHAGWNSVPGRMRTTKRSWKDEFRLRNTCWATVRYTPLIYYTSTIYNHMYIYIYIIWNLPFLATE